MEKEGFQKPNPYRPNTSPYLNHNGLNGKYVLLTKKTHILSRRSPKMRENDSTL